MGSGGVTGIVLEAYSPLGNPGRPDKKDGEPEVMQDSTIRDIASKHHATPAQVGGASLFVIHVVYHLTKGHGSCTVQRISQELTVKYYFSVVTNT